MDKISRKRQISIADINDIKLELDDKCLEIDYAIVYD
jgi:hypothetical protein